MVPAMHSNTALLMERGMEWKAPKNQQHTKTHMKIENNTLLGHYVRWGIEISENLVIIPAGEYVEQNGWLVLMLDSGEPSAKHSYIPVQQ